MLGGRLVRTPEIKEFTTGITESIADTFLSASFVFIYVFVIVLTEQQMCEKGIRFLFFL